MGTCTQVTNATSTDITGLTAANPYEYNAYSATGCADTDLIATANFRTLQSGSGEVLSYTNLTQTTVRITLKGHDLGWWYTVGTRAAGEGPCTLVWSNRSPPTTSVSLSQLTAGTAYTFIAYSDSTCSTEIASISFSTASGPTLTATNVASSTATLSIANYSGQWWYKANTGPDTTCQGPVAAGTATKDLTGLASSTSYTYYAYSASGCASANQLDSETFTTFAGISMSVSHLATTTATLTLSGYTGNWWYKGGDRSQGPDVGTCTQVTGASVTLSNLTGGRSYTYKAFNAGTCASGAELYEVTFNTPGAGSPSFAASNIGTSTATLTISNHAGSWWFMGSSRAGGGPGLGVCTPTSGTSVNLTGLSGNTSYTYNAFSDSTCTTANQLGSSVSFRTLAALTASNVTATTATLTIGNWTSQWWYKANAGPDSTCQGPVAENTASKDLTGLTAGTTYTYTVYSVTGCASEELLGTGTFTTSSS